MTDAEIAGMSSTEKIGEAMQRSLPHLPADARGVVEGMVQPQSLGIIAGTLVVWAGSHFFGFGEVVDIVLLAVGVVAVGFSVFEGVGALYDFADQSISAETDADLEVAGRHFARAVVILGISTIQAVLMRGPAKAVIARGRPQIYPRMRLPPPPSSGSGLQVSRPPSLPGGNLGQTSAYGIIKVARNQSLTEQRLTLLHELVHRYFSPTTGPLRQVRAELRMSGYARSSLLRYLEEAMAEGYAQLRVNGLERAVQAVRFPLQGGYVTVSQLAGEGTAIGTITLGGSLFYVTVSLGAVPEAHP